MRYGIFFLLCLTLAACGTKPKELKGNEPFPLAYPQAENPAPIPPAGK